MPEKMIVAIDASTLDTWDMCNRKYDLQMNKRLTTAYRNINLDRGGLIHLMLKNYYTLKMLNAKKIAWTHEHNLETHKVKEYLKTPLMIEVGFNFNEAVNSSLLLAYEVETDMTAPQIEETINIVKGYFFKYQHQNWEILWSEKPFSIELYNSESLQIIGQGISDLGVNVPQLGQAIVDFKKRSRREEESSFNHQRLMYTYALKINTFITDKLVFIKDTDRYHRQINQYSAEEHEEWLGEVVGKVKQMIAYTKLNMFMRNPTSCDKYGGCMYKNFCSLAPSRRELQMGRLWFEGEVWDPGRQLEKKNV